MNSTIRVGVMNRLVVAWLFLILLLASVSFQYVAAAWAESSLPTLAGDGHEDTPKIW